MIQLFSRISSYTRLALRLHQTNFRSRFSSQPQTSIKDVNANIPKIRKLPLETEAKDIIIYKSDNVKFHGIVSLFAASQFIFWSLLAFNTYQMKETPVKAEGEKKDTTIWERFNFGHSYFRIPLSVFILLFGYGAATIAYLYTTRSIRYLILRKDRKNIAFVTYSFIPNSNRIMNVPIDCISAEGSRISGQNIPLKVKGVKLFYTLDAKGVFTRPDLFDSTAGMRRNFFFGKPKKKSWFSKN